MLGPIKKALGISACPRITLPINPLEPPSTDQQPIFRTDDFIIKLLVSDCGGHGGALEILANTLKESNAQYLSFEDLMRQIRDKLVRSYSSIIPSGFTEASALFLAIVTQQRLYAGNRF